MTQKDPRYRTKRWRQLRDQVIRRDGRRCAITGCITDMTAKGMTHVDHINEAQDGGDFWDPDNCQVLCKHHHDSKTAAVRATIPRQPISPNA
ncbi:MAG: HNH endonuclease [Chloroflexi bacterium]|nr:HNH endonuclease [Chloroflexota bacterium]